MTIPRQLAPTVGLARDGVEFLKGSSLQFEKVRNFPVQNQRGNFTSACAADMRRSVETNGRLILFARRVLQVVKLIDPPNPVQDRQNLLLSDPLSPTKVSAAGLPVQAPWFLLRIGALVLYTTSIIILFRASTKSCSREGHDWKWIRPSIWSPPRTSLQSNWQRFTSDLLKPPILYLHLKRYFAAARLCSYGYRCAASEKPPAVSPLLRFQRSNPPSAAEPPFR